MQSRAVDVRTEGRIRAMERAVPASRHTTRKQVLYPGVPVPKDSELGLREIVTEVEGRECVCVSNASLLSPWMMQVFEILTLIMINPTPLNKNQVLCVCFSNWLCF